MAAMMPDLSELEAAPEGAETASSAIRAARSRALSAQAAWDRVPLKERLVVVRRARNLIAEDGRALGSVVSNSMGSSIQRSIADTLVAEVLPLAEACRFLEREAGSLLQSKKLGRQGRPFWLGGVEAEVQRVALGVVLVIAPANYPLFLPGVQCLQAIVAGNAVLWKPAPGGEGAARRLCDLFLRAGFPRDLIQVLDSSAASGIEAIRVGVDKVFLTGHANTGRTMMHELAKTLTPSVMELSGCDAVFVLPGVDRRRLCEALAFGLRLNGSATCMAPRRVFVTDNNTSKILDELEPRLAGIRLTVLKPETRALLDALITDACERGARIVLDGRETQGSRPTILANVPRGAQVLRTDIFAPLLSFCMVPTVRAALEIDADCPYALTASIFGPAVAARKLSSLVRAGTVLINDLIVSTADPRIPFGGRGASGFGVTRGREGLLEMTAVKTILRKRGSSLRAYEETSERHEPLFEGYMQTAHASPCAKRWTGFRRMVAAARSIAKR